jgi:hypothetical protein
MKVTIKAHVHAKDNQKWDSEKSQYVRSVAWVVFPWNGSDTFTDHVYVGEQEFTAEIPDDFDIRDGLVANLRAELAKAAAAFQKRQTELNAQIQSLLAIPMES